MKSHETLQQHDTFRAREQEAHEISEAHRDSAERMYESRARSLEQLAAHIGTALYEALARKIEHERTALLELFAREEKATAQKRRLDKVLKTEYFTYRTLDTNLL